MKLSSAPQLTHIEIIQMPLRLRTADSTVYSIMEILCKEIKSSRAQILQESSSNVGKKNILFL